MAKRRLSRGEAAARRKVLRYFAIAQGRPAKSDTAALAWVQALMQADIERLEGKTSLPPGEPPDGH
jgi:hypothetical protein